MNSPKIRAAIWQLREEKFGGWLGSISANKLEVLLTDPEVPYHVQLAAARLGLGLAGHIEKNRKDLMPASGQGKTLNDMTEQELLDFIEAKEMSIKTLTAECVESIDIQCEEKTTRADEQY